MDDSKRKRRATPRVRSGCLPCRQSHQKCDERRPACGLCQRRSRACSYAMRITWGGRPFAKSAFGTCMSDRPRNRTQAGSVVQVVAEEPGDKAKEDQRKRPPFVYGIDATPVFHNVTSPVAKDRDPHLAEWPATPCRELVTTPSSLPDLPPAYKPLLDYFVHAVESFSCDENVKQDFCSAFLPLAFGTSHVMASVLNMSAVHRVNAGLPQNDKQLALLQMVTVNQLRDKLSRGARQSTSERSTETVMATIIMLCYAEIVAGGRKAQSWRVHLEGAAAVLQDSVASWTTQAESPTRAFLAKCFVSLVALANVSGCPPARSVSRLAIRMSDTNDQKQTIDAFTSCSTDLLHVFVEIGDALVEQRQSEGGDIPHTKAGPSARHRCSQLMPTLLQGAGRLQNLSGKGTDQPTSPLSVRQGEFVSINKAYHEAAILQINQRIRKLPSSGDEIQSNVQNILTLVADVQFQRGPCPAIVLLFPLFSAGCGAVCPQDRERVKRLLSRMAEMYQLATVRHSICVLESLWRHRDEYGESDRNVSWETFVDNDMDLILY